MQRIEVIFPETKRPNLEEMSDSCNLFLRLRD